MVIFTGTVSIVKGDSGVTWVVPNDSESKVYFLDNNGLTVSCNESLHVKGHVSIDISREVEALARRSPGEAVFCMHFLVATDHRIALGCEWSSVVVYWFASCRTQHLVSWDGPIVNGCCPAGSDPTGRVTPITSDKRRVLFESMVQS